MESTVAAQRRLYRLMPEPLREVDAWLVPFPWFWSEHVDALERYLDRTDQPNKQSLTKRKTAQDGAAQTANKLAPKTAQSRESRTQAKGQPPGGGFPDAMQALQALGKLPTIPPFH